MAALDGLGVVVPTEDSDVTDGEEEDEAGEDSVAVNAEVDGDTGADDDAKAQAVEAQARALAEVSEAKAKAQATADEAKAAADAAQGNVPKMKAYMEDMGKKEVSFQWKNPDFLLQNPDFLLKNVDFVIKQKKKAQPLLDEAEKEARAMQEQAESAAGNLDLAVKAESAVVQAQAEAEAVQVRAQGQAAPKKKVAPKKKAKTLADEANPDAKLAAGQHDAPTSMGEKRPLPGKQLQFGDGKASSERGASVYVRKCSPPCDSLGCLQTEAACVLAAPPGSGCFHSLLTPTARRHNGISLARPRWRRTNRRCAKAPAATRRWRSGCVSTQALPTTT